METRAPQVHEPQAAPHAVEGALAAPPGAPALARAPAAPAPHAEEGIDPATLPRIRWWAVCLALAVAGAAFYRLRALGMDPHLERVAAARSAAEAYDPRPVVDLVKPKRGAASFDLRLPADVDSFQETAIFARTSGYLRRILVDIGDHVVAGQPLAEIDTPEVDAQVVWAKAAVQVARANVSKLTVDLELGKTTLKRYEGSAATGGVEAQQLDEKRSAVAQAKTALAAAEASVVLAEAEVLRQTTLQGFGRIAAPFAGVITARGYDVGALLGPSGPSAPKEILRLERGDVLRAWVNVPQAYISSAKLGAKAYLTVRNWPGREFEGALARTAGVLDPSTRTLRCQIDVPNADGTLASGMFGAMRFPVTTDRPTLTVPTSAPTFGAAGPTVWVVANDHVQGRKVTLGRDFGTEIEVVEGLSAEDDVVRNPGERLLDGLEVRVAPPPATAAPPAALPTAAPPSPGGTTGWPPARCALTEVTSPAGSGQRS